MKDCIVCGRFFVLIFTVGVFLGCGKLADTKRHSFNPSAKILFIEEKVHNHGIGSPPYGELILMDFETKEQKRLTNNEFFETSPYFTLSGDTILFQANYQDDPALLAIKGVSGPYEIYTLDLDSKNISKVEIRYQTERTPLLRNTLYDLQIIDGSKYLFRYAGENKIYLYDIKQRSENLLKHLKEFRKVEDLTYKNDRILFKYSTDTDSTVNKGVAMYHLSVDSTEILISDNWQIGGWAIDGKKILLSQDSLICEYDFNTRKKSVVFAPPTNASLVIGDPFYISDNEIVFLGSSIISDPSNESLQSPYANNEVYLLNMDSKKVTQLTNSGKEKLFLRAFYSTRGIK